MGQFRITLLFATIASLFIVGCNDKGAQTDENTGPKYKQEEVITLLDQLPEKLTVSAETGGTLQFSEGTKITIPPNAFLCEGKPVGDSVDISFEQYTNTFDIYASGIPMEYDSAGHSYTFESAGMCKIEGSYNGKPLTIAPNKSLGIEMLSRYDETDYSSYYFDTVKGQWQNTGKDIVKPLPNTDTVDMVNKLATFSVKRQQNTLPPDLEEKESVIPVMIYDINRFPQLRVFSSVAFDVAPEEMDRMQDIQQQAWYEMEVDTNTSMLTLIGNRKEVKIKGTILLEGKPYIVAMRDFPEKNRIYEQRMRIRDSLQNEVAFRRKAIEANSKATRFFQASGFGIWNIDKPLLAKGKMVNLTLKGQDTMQTFLYTRLAYKKYNGVFKPYTNDMGELQCKLLDGQHIIYATGIDFGLYVGCINDNEIKDISREYIVSMHKVEKPEMLYQHLRSQVSKKEDEITIASRN